LRGLIAAWVEEDVRRMSALLPPVAGAMHSQKD
jgi:hypothetical protein